MKSVLEETIGKGDWAIELALPYIDGETVLEHEQLIRQLIGSIFDIKTTFIAPRLLVEVRQPVVGRVANAIIRMCLHGVQSCVVRTLFPGDPALSADVKASHIILRYGDGRVIEQETTMSHDSRGGEPLIHSVTVMFDRFHVETNEWVRPGRPILSIVRPAEIPVAEVV